MKQQTNFTLMGGILTACIVILSSFDTAVENLRPGVRLDTPSSPTLTEALEVLQNKCNVCHRRQNPFMVFNERNMVKRAKRINRAVFIQKRMPKGDQVQLSDDEYNTLKKWLSQVTEVQTKD